MNSVKTDVNEIISDVLKRTAGLSQEENDAVIIALVLHRTQANSAKQENRDSKGERLLTVEEAAQKLACSKDRLYRHPKEFASFELYNGGQLRFSERGIERYIARNMGRSQSD